MNKYNENFQEIDEHSPYFDPNYFENKELIVDEEIKPTISIWRNWWTTLNSLF